jgi:hypothetical protein
LSSSMARMIKKTLPITSSNYHQTIQCFSHLHTSVGRDYYMPPMFLECVY